MIMDAVKIRVCSVVNTGLATRGTYGAAWSSNCQGPDSLSGARASVFSVELR